MKYEHMIKQLTFEYIIKQLTFTISMFKNIDKKVALDGFFYDKEKDELMFKNDDVIVSKINTTVTVIKNNQIIFKSNPKQIKKDKDAIFLLSDLTNKLNKIFIELI